MTTTCFSSRIAARAGIVCTTIALVGAAGAAGTTLFAISTLVASDSSQRITLVAKRGSPEPMPARATMLAMNGASSQVER